jgi:hypothetical protein
MSLPWVRLDSNIGTNDKVLELLAEKDGARAFVLYVCSLGYAGGHATDGLVKKQTLPVNHGNERLAQMLVEYGLWEYDEAGGGHYRIRNWETRQQTNRVAEAKRDAQQLAAKRTNCIRYHGKECGCWSGDAK